MSVTCRVRLVDGPALASSRQPCEATTMTTSDARRDDADGVVTVTFTRDEKLNAVSAGMFSLLEGAVTDLAERDDLRVLVITAEGRFFTAGVDIADMQGQLGQGTDGVVRGSNIRRQYRMRAHHDLFDELEQIEKPIVLAVQGPCMGVGVELGVSCDFRLASDAATFGLPEIPNLAVLPGSGGISRLTRLVGPHWARWLAMAGETVDAHQALTIGLVHDVYPAAEFPERVQAFARRLAGLPREAAGLAKVAIDAAASVDRRTAREIDRLAQTLLFESPEFRDRVEAFSSLGRRGSQ
jgi:enoyl-CoA hydratase